MRDRLIDYYRNQSFDDLMDAYIRAREWYYTALERDGHTRFAERMMRRMNSAYYVLHQRDVERRLLLSKVRRLDDAALVRAADGSDRP